jgi:hypothetical protein
MFDKDINILYGDRCSGRSQFLLEISQKLKRLGFKLVFIGCTSEFKEMKNLLEDFEYFIFLDSSVEFNNKKNIEVIKEKSENNKYDFIIVDDIDYLSQECFDMISSINVSKIVSLLKLPNKIKNNYCSIYNIRTVYDDSEFKHVTTITDSVSKIEYTIPEIIKNLTREQKINTILKNDKS